MRTSAAAWLSASAASTERRTRPKKSSSHEASKPPAWVISLTPSVVSLAAFKGESTRPRVALLPEERATAPLRFAVGQMSAATT